MKSLFNEETIIISAKLALQSARRFAEAFVEFGIGDRQFTALHENIVQAEQTAGALHHRVDLKQLTSKKNDELEACYQWGSRLRMRLELAFGRGSAEMRAFPSSHFKKALHSETEMMSLMEVLLHIAKEHQVVLAAHGQTAQVLTVGESLLQALRQADMEQESKKGNKKSATQERHQLFQSIYDETNKLNRIGRMLFADDPAKAALFESRWPYRRSTAKGKPGEEESPVTENPVV